MTDYLGGDYVLVEYPNTYTFVDNIIDFSKNIDDFYLEDQKYERMINMDINVLLKDIFISLNKNNSLWEQFIIDAKRSNVYLNNKYIKPHNLKNIITYIKDKNENIDEKIIKNILALSTQTSCAIPFSIIQTNLNKTNYFLSELSHREKFLNIDKKMIISIIVKEDNIIVKNKKNLRIFKLQNSDDITVSLVNINLEFNLNKPMYSIFKISFTPMS